jgi:putative peptide zinc metalloprotease protein
MTDTGPYQSSNEQAAQPAASQDWQGQPGPSPEIPERPALPPNVRLIGELQETGFEDRQWLVQRDGRFIQLTELLYRVAEHANGERTPREIAAAVTGSTDRLVSADNVRQLIRDKLIPMGLIATADRTVVPPVERARSPLAVGMRARVLSPRRIESLTKVLQIFFAPPVLVVMLIAVAIAHGWVYLVQGMGSAVRDMLYVPGLLLLVLAFIVAAGIFHEFGHASALRYGGGKVRGMGVGIYLIYPVFYTDATDSYRLDRGARVRTDLGGIYFHLIFALGVIGLYLLSGQEFLLFVVLLLNLDIIRQFLPFVRLDGYWALADLTGIPDFFSQMGAFLRSVLPVPGWKRSTLPGLKPWVKKVFAAYVLVTVPLLATILFFFVIHLPHMVTTVWYSLVHQARQFSWALETGSYPGMALSVAQAFILALQMLGIAYFLYRVVRLFAEAVWKRRSLIEVEAKVGRG